MSEGMWMISTGLLWMVVIALIVVVYSLTRQIGVLYERIAPAGALAMNRSVKAGEQAPNFKVKTITEDTIDIAPTNTGKSQLLFFLSPDCPICKQLLRPLKSAAKAEHDWLDVVIASDGDNVKAHKAFVEREALGDYPYVLSEALGKSYGVSKLPYGVLIDEQGQIAALGIINSREHLESLFAAKELGVSDIQTYIANQQPQGPKMASNNKGVQS